MKKKLRRLLTIVLCLVILSACSKKQAVDSQTNNASKSAGEQATHSKDELVLGFGSEPEGGWDPIHGSGHYGTALFQSALLKRDTDLNIVPDLAKSYEVSKDKKTINVELKDGLKFSDGSDLTANDVAFTYNLAKKEGTPGVNLTRLKNVEAKDDKHVEINLNEPDISFTSSMCSLAIVPEKSYGPDYAKNPIGSGPFKFVEWKNGQQLIVEPNEYYIGEKVPFKKITFLFFKDEDQALATAKSGVCDMIRIPISAKHSNFPGFHIESIKTVDNRGVSLPMVADAGKVTDDKSIHPGSPIGNNVTSDKAIRRALDVAMDRREIIDTILDGEGTPAYSIADGLPWFNEKTIEDESGNIEKAKKLLDEAGWKEGSDGIREKKGVKAKFNLYYAYQDREDIATYFTDQAKKIGIEITPIFGDWDLVGPHMYSDAVLFGWGGYDPLEMFYNYSSQYNGVEYYNPNFYSNKKVDEYFEKGLSSSSVEELNENFKLAQWDGQTGLSAKGDCPWVWLVNENHLYLVRDGLEIGKQKIQPHGGGWPMLDTISKWKWSN
ncbi:ABC transporter substrate-binding protein [Aedoeadaptatus coxii]|uniref:ABC transporter substrate-binding protein n=1 Tax=Aedoeadaptatus coxii TaxID=755172 RepID=UPI002AD2D394|nr:ABC transporter substrate-binding protein [Peptoniphilus coxii]